MAVGAGSAWAIVVSVVTLPITLAGLGASAFGTWVLLSTFSASSGWFSVVDAGVGAAATREVASRASLDDLTGTRHVASAALSTFVTLGAGLGAVFALLGPRVLPALFSTPDRLVDDLRFAVVVYAVQVVVDQVANTAIAVLDGLQRVAASRALDATRRTASAAAVAGAAAAGAGLRGVAVASLGGSCLGAVVAVVLLVRACPGRWVPPRWAEVRGLLAYAKVVAVLQPLGVITRQMDRIIVGSVLGPAPVALIEIATQIQNGSTAVLTASSYVAKPASSWVHAREETGLLRELVQRGTKYSLLITYPVTVGLMVLAGDLVHLWVGPAYAAAAGLTVLALADTLVTSPLQVSSNTLIGMGRASVVFRVTVAAVAINLVASLILVRVIGAAGAFAGTLIAFVLVGPLLLRATCGLLDLPVRSFVRTAIAPAALACVPMALAAGAVVLADLAPVVTVALASLVGALTYVAVAGRFSLSSAERGELRALLSRRQGLR